MVKRTIGQRRKLIAIALSIATFALIAVGGMSLLARSGTLPAWTDDPGKAVATITRVHMERERRIGTSARVSSRDVMKADYRFEVDGRAYGNRVAIDEHLLEGVEVGDELNVWYERGNPKRSLAVQTLALATMSDNRIGHALKVIPIALTVAFVLFRVLSLFYVRESRRALADGFYTDSSWLDVEDRTLVYLREGSVTRFTFDKSRTRKLQKAYQSGTAPSELCQFASKGSVKSVAFDAISDVHARHDKDTIDLRHGEEHVSLDFLTPVMRDHALERIVPLLPTGLDASVEQRTRWQAARPALLVLSILVAVALWLNDPALQAVIAFLALVTLVPKLVRRLSDPTVVRAWGLPDDAGERAATATG